MVFIPRGHHASPPGLRCTCDMQGAISTLLTPCLSVTSCQLRGSKFVEDINDKFSAQMTNVVRWRVAGEASAMEGGHKADCDKEIVSTTSLRVSGM
jgi:hypothetical protein